MSALPIQLFRPDVPYGSQAEERCIIRYQFENVHHHGDEGAEDGVVYQGSIYSNWNPNTDPSEDFDLEVFRREVAQAMRMVLAKQGKRLIRADSVDRVSFELGDHGLA